MSANRWFRFYAEAVNDPKVQRLPPDIFKACLLEAMSGTKNDFSIWVKPGNDRPLTKDWAIIRASIFERDDYTCTYCGSRGQKLECDHVIPVSAGGSNGDENLVTACKPCNQSKRSKSVTIEEWRNVRRIAS